MARPATVRLAVQQKLSQGENVGFALLQSRHRRPDRAEMSPAGHRYHYAIQRCREHFGQ